MFDANLPVKDLDPTVAEAFTARNLPPRHIQQRLATIHEVPPEEFPVYMTPEQLEPTATMNLGELPNPNVPTTNLIWGDDLSSPKPDHHTRIFFQNIFGLRLTTDGTNKWIDCLQHMHHHQCDIFGFAETHCNWTRNRVRQKITKTAAQFLPQFRMTTSKNSYIHDSDYLPGGTLTATHGPWSGRLNKILEDPHRMGRWSGQQYKIHSGHQLVVLTAYRVCKQDSNDGVYSSHKQQQLSLRQRFGPDHTPCPRQAFITDMIDYVRALELTDEDFLIIMLDANEVMGEDSYGLINLIEQLRLVDIFERHHQRQCDITTYANSKNRRLDYILGTNNILPFITNCGYSSFQSGIDSDHRACFVELNRTFTDGRARMHTPPKRVIGYNTNKREVLKYKNYITDKFTNGDVFSRAQTLSDRATLNMPDITTFLKDLNALDREVTNIMLESERTQCIKKPPFRWSPAIHQSSLIIKYWQLVQSSDRHHRDRKQQKQEIFDQLSEENQKAISDILLDNNTSSTYRLHRAKIDKQRLQLTQKNHCAKTKRQRMEADATFYEIDPEQALKRMGMKEESAHLFKYLDTVYQKKKGHGISHIEVPYRNAEGAITSDPLTATEWIKIDDPEKFVPMILQRNIEHFGQAKCSPFATTPLADVFGYTGTNLSATNLIDHGIIPQSCTTTEVHQGAQAILHKLADNGNSAASVFHMGYEEFWSGFSKWDERTSTSPSNRHLGHYKVLQISDGNDSAYKRKPRNNRNYEEDDILEEAKIPNPSEAIKLVYYNIAMAAVKSGNTLRRWCNSSSLMLEKTPGSPKIHKLRVIHVYEADYNLMLKILWARQLVWKSHSQHMLHRGQSGSRPDHRCSDVILRKEMNYLYARLTRTALATVDNDAKACYDRILCNLAMLVSRYYGMSTEACLFHANTLKAMKYRVRTATSGDSTNYYEHSETTPIHGSGQGSCASPALWLLISSILMHVFDRSSNGMVQFDVQKGTTKNTSAEGFVDDVALFTNLHALVDSDLPTLRKALSEDINTWQETLAGSGGKLELIKCFYYILMWRFNKTGDPIPMTKTELYDAGHTDITIQDPDTKQRVTIDHKCIDQVHRTLGAYKTISGDESEQFKVLLAKSNQLAIHTSQGQLTRSQARRAYSSIYIPSMSYSLVTTNLSLKLIADIQSKAMMAFLPAMGYERTFPRAVVFGPRRNGGLNLCQLYTETSVAKVSAVISHIRANTGLGQTMLVNINWLQLHSGSFQPILSSTSSLPYLKQNWILHMREFLWSINGKISIPAQWVPIAQRRHDVALMDRFCELSVGKDVLRIANNWRLFFQVTTLSDITTADGTRIQPKYWLQGRHDLTIGSAQTTTLNWPIQARPESQHFGKWIKCLKAAFRIDTAAGLLPTHLQLGDWTITHKESANRWTSYYDSSTQCLYQAQSPNWLVHPLQCPEGRPTPHSWAFATIPDTITDSLPPNAFPVTAFQQHQKLIVRHRNFYGPIQPYIATIHNFEDHVVSLPKWRSDLLMHWSSVPTHLITEALLNNDKLYMASDGAYNEEDQTGAFGVIIASQNEEFLTNQCTAPGAIQLHSSFRSELYGLLAGCILLNEVIQYCHLIIQPHHQLQIYIDNKGVVDRVNRHQRQDVALSEMLATDIDLEIQILQEIKLLRATGLGITPILHVKAHQDNKTPFHSLSREAQLNTKADSLAAQVSSDQLVSIQYSVPTAVPATLYINDIPITSKVQESLRDAYNSQALRTYMQNKYGWKDSVIDDIWWEGNNRALKRLSHADRQTIQKFNFHHLPTLRRECLKNRDIPEQCPHCGINAIETDDHILLCTSPQRMQAKQHWERIVYEYLSKEFTPTVMKQAIMLALHSWLLMQPIPNIDVVLPHLPPNVRAAYNAQTAIGWNHFIRGRSSYLWRSLIQQHLRDNKISGKKMSSLNWITGLLLSFWNGVLAIWDVRNKEYHGHDPATNQTALRKRLLLEAIPLLHHAEFAHPNDRHWFDHTEDTLTEYSVISLKAWIRNARTMVRIRHREQLLASLLDESLDNRLAAQAIENTDGLTETLTMQEAAAVEQGD